MTTWQTTFLVEPWPDTPWDRGGLETWRRASAQHSYALVAHQRSFRVSVAIEAAEEGEAVVAGRERVLAFFPPARYTIRNPTSAPSSRNRRLLHAGAALFLRQAAAAVDRHGRA